MKNGCGVHHLGSLSLAFHPAFKSAKSSATLSNDRSATRSSSDIAARVPAFGTLVSQQLGRGNRGTHVGEKLGGLLPASVRARTTMSDAVVTLLGLRELQCGYTLASAHKRFVASIEEPLA